MAIFRYSSSVPHDRDTVFGYHERPGALARLSPGFGGGVSRIISGPSDGIRPGSRVRMSIAVPGSFGRVGVPWTAEHVELRSPEFFRDDMVSGPLRSWEHRHTFTDEGEATRIDDEVTYDLGPGTLGEGVFASQLARVFGYRERALRGDLDFLSRLPGRRGSVVLSGASGLIGNQVAALLGVAGFRVTRLVRRAATGPGEATWDPDRGVLDPGTLAGADHVMHLGGTPILGRFTRAHKRAVLTSRVRSTQLIAETLAGLPAADRPRSFVCSSAIGYYGDDRGDELLQETSSPGHGFLAEVCRAWEAATRSAARAGVRTVNARTGLVLSPSGGLLGALWPLFGAGLGGRIGSGRQWQSWISLDDMASALVHSLVADELEGPVNLVAPQPVRNEEFTRAFARAVHRPAVVPVPAAAVNLALGGEAASAMALASQRVAGARLAESGFVWRHPSLEPALAHMLGTAA